MEREGRAALDWILKCGWKGLCPRCGEGHMFASWIKVADTCDVCGLDFGFATPDDGPAFFSLCIIAFPLIFFAMWVELAFAPPTWVHFLTSGPALLIGCTAGLRPIKGWGWIALGGLVTLLAGLVIMAGWPVNSLWILCLFLAIDITMQGLALIAFGFLWERLTFWNGWSAPLAHVLWISFYIVWAAILLGGIWGTGRALPIAGTGHVAAKWQEQLTLLPLALGSFASFGVIVMLLIQWRWKA